ncbi:MAG: HEAT repeat domain-containing protein [Candidatus Sumerlaeia bacterium]|nr:HEAT repeat domain-containing protein [Candidatus Sumerlaeia bacterium]
MEATKETKKKERKAKAPAPAAQPTPGPIPGETKEQEERRLIGLLQAAGTPEFDKDVACRRLGIIGTRASVPALAALLDDEHLCDVARWALEKIPDPSVDKALRAALNTVKGRNRIAVINSIGARGDREAVAGLAKCISDSDMEVALAATAALGRIGGPEAVAALTKAMGSGPAAVQAEAGDALTRIAEGMLAAGRNAEAVKLFDAVRAAKPAKPVMLAAMRGAIMARKSEGAALLIEQIKGEDWEMCDVALRAVRELPGAEMTKALAAEVAKLPPPKQVLLLKALGDRHDRAALPAALEAAKSSEAKVRAAAVEVLGQIGDESAAPALFAAAADSEPAVARVALASLIGMPDAGGKVNAAILSGVADKNPKIRAAAVEAAGKRHIPKAASAIAKVAEDSDVQVRVAAMKGLTALAVMQKGEAAEKEQAKKAALALAEKLAASHAFEAAEAKKRLTQPLAPEGFVKIVSTGLAGGAAKAKQEKQEKK